MSLCLIRHVDLGNPEALAAIVGRQKSDRDACLQDPYANAYWRHWRKPEDVDSESRRIGRGGWVATRNYELDSGAYFLNMLWNYHTTPALFAAERSSYQPFSPRMAE